MHVNKGGGGHFLTHPVVCFIFNSTWLTLYLFIPRVNYHSETFQILKIQFAFLNTILFLLPYL